MQDVLTSLAPVIDALVELDLTDRAAAEAELDRRVPGEVRRAVAERLKEAHAAASLTPRQANEDVRFGRLARPGEATRGFSVDVVDIRGPGAAHTHPRGEVSFCVPLEGEPTFEGAREGFVVLPPGSRHVPAVTGGRMLIVYFLPDGAVDWS